MKLLLSSIIIATLTVPMSFAHPPEGTVDPAVSDWYKSLKDPKTGWSCCSVADCRATELRPDPNDHSKWQAYISKDIWGITAPNDWMTIPPEHVLHNHDNPTGQVVICYYGNEIHCAVLPSLT
jgi:hypothetical protein